MYEFSYNEVVEESPQLMRARERQAMDRVIDLLRTARARGPGAREVDRSAVLSCAAYGRSFWTI